MHYNNKSNEIESNQDVVLSNLGNELDSDTSLLRAIRSSVKDLPSTEPEIREIGKLLKKKKIKCGIFTEYSATEESFKALSGNAPNLIHIATHGKYWPKFEADKDFNLKEVSFLKDDLGNIDINDALNRSVLLFSGANRTLSGCIYENGEDEVLTAREISLLDLNNVDLIVLSACQTGIGEIHEDGVFGLQRGLKKAGVNSILMSLWEVDDDATQLLMTEFYKNYVSGISKRQSLLNAQKVVREFSGDINGQHREFSNPRYWASFILLDAIN
jgi:CHAT domain-containing protein